MNYPALPSRVGKRGTLVVPPNGERLRFTITDEIRRVQSDLPSKIIVLERVLFDDGRIELRLAYHIIAKNQRCTASGYGDSTQHSFRYRTSLLSFRRLNVWAGSKTSKDHGRRLTRRWCDLFT